MSDNELGEFLRSRREAITPAQVGLPTGPRRRVPGLRRAELATLAGMSVDYLTRLEQGRDRHPSPQVLGALADALRLSTTDRNHLQLLWGRNKPRHMCPRSITPPDRTVRANLLALLDRLDPTPAIVVNRLSEVLAHTAGYERLSQPIGLLDGTRPSLARFVFGDPRARSAHPDWDRVADELVSFLKAESHGTDPAVTHLADELAVTAGAAFTDRWRATTRLPGRSGVQRWVHPEVGELRLNYEILQMSEMDSQRLVVYLPADQATAEALDRLNGRQPGALRVVAG